MNEQIDWIEVLERCNKEDQKTLTDNADNVVITHKTVVLSDHLNDGYTNEGIE